MADEKDFELGFVFAGAVSAGAYSAGVIDFIVEALDAYEHCRTHGRTPEGEVWDGPTHAVRVPVMAGASAGGMTVAMTAMQLHSDFDHAGPGLAVPEPTRNRLYASWVDEIDIAPLLDLRDFEGGAPLRSLLSCRVLDEIVDRTLAVPAIRTRRWVGRGESNGLAVLLTVSDTGGVPYRFRLESGASDAGYAMLNHGDDMRFLVGRSPVSLDRHTGFEKLDLDAPNKAVRDLFGKAALATGAFPIGLAARALDHAKGDYARSDRVGFERVRRDGTIEFVPTPPVPPDADGRHSFVAVDGGVIDNEPLELARRFLSPTAAANPANRNGRETSYAVVLVDPFPNRATWPADNEVDRLSKVAPSLISMLVNQARFKPQELTLALDGSVFSRFAILPEPQKPPTAEALKLPIACGALGGFSGFLHRSFRHHDYCLGRRNAQAFLQRYLCLPETNPLFDAWKAAGGNPAAWYVEQADPAQGTTAIRQVPEVVATKTAPDPPRKPALPIIPLTPRLKCEIKIGPADRPRPDDVERDLSGLRRRLSERFSEVVAHLVDDEIKDYVPGGWFGRQALKQFLPGVARDKAMEMIGASLRDIRAAFPNQQ